MAGASLLMLLDDITAVLDDVAAMSKVAARKTVGVLGDDLALNAQQVSGVAAARELPVVWAVALGSLKNKAILVPIALIISAVAPWLITPLLMCGGLFLCFEGSEKLLHWYQLRVNQGADNHQQPANLLKDRKPFCEQEKIKGAIRTDFVLSAEIIAIGLGVVAKASLIDQLLTLTVIAITMTAGVYGLVACIVKIDDVGLYLSKLKGQGQIKLRIRKLGLMLITAAPNLMKTLTVAGTIAMFTVGGGIITHGFDYFSLIFSDIESSVVTIEFVGPEIAWGMPFILNGCCGVLIGFAVLAVINSVKKITASA
ncbi:DUF808 domain-containing protein [Shewanella intestini]|uniref:DUF808 family protein n=1 Tax=Shewanella intestini TaxID=2017544 RepID=A0ABS5HZB8_9GAMM|nr:MULTISPECIES: DUF808 domain-containing protein [Shewanella]MBR9727129.1 DUF808 family protein [Shewanella intestini]MRG35931.1 DUF808 family protein [Shewanella sp. XMDDZSB0408]